MEKRELENYQSVPALTSLESPFESALESVDDILLKKYLLSLSDYEIVPLDECGLSTERQENIRLFKVTEMVYEKEGLSTDKFATLFSTFSNKSHSIFLIIDSDGNDIDLYLGINTNGENISANKVNRALESTFKSQFPGIKTMRVMQHQTEKISEKITNYQHVSSYSGVAFDRNEDNKKNEEFVQGLERFLSTMEGKVFTGIVLATPIPTSELSDMQKQLQAIYTNLSSFKNHQIGYTLTKNENYGESLTTGTSQGVTTSTTIGKSETEGTSISNGTSKSSGISQALTAVGAIVAGAATIAGTGGLAAPAVIGAVAAGGVSTIAGALTNKQTSYNKTQTNSTTLNESETTGNTSNHSESVARTTGFSTGDSKSLTLTKENKEITEILKNIDEQLTRQKTFDNTGAFGCAAYFFSDNPYEVEFATSSYRALVSGEKTMLETSATNVWNSEHSVTPELKKYLSHFIHPIFRYNKFEESNIEVTPVSIVSGRELALHMGLPRKSVANFPVIEHASFGTAVFNSSSYEEKSNVIGSFSLGKIYHLGEEKKQNIDLDIESLSMHTFITGSTGSGKSNTTYLMLDKLMNRNIKCLVIEPAKGEYKHVFGNREDVSVYGTNSNFSDLLRINPFYFPEGTHVLEHVDRLIEIFNVCWPMYAAMPAILKEATLNAYSSVGWDLITSCYSGESNIYPNFIDLEKELEKVISASSYSEDTKGDYIGALVTRVHSLSIGLNQFIFTQDDLTDEELFEENVMVDLSRIGSSETKSLIMGLLVMRLNEYRVSQANALSKMNEKIKHITVLEEAHHLLKRTSQEQSGEGSNMIGKSVEMLTNSIAEMRTYGEGFIIIDQSPSSVDIAAIKNTNTKIIMKTPEFSDRELVGKSVGLDSEQIDEVLKLPKGVAVVFQNDWLEPVLCQVTKYKQTVEMFKYKQPIFIGEREAQKNMLQFLLGTFSGKMRDAELLKNSLGYIKVSSLSKAMLTNLIERFLNENENVYENLTKENHVRLLTEIINIPTFEVQNLLIESSDEVELYHKLNKKVRDRFLTGTEDDIKNISLAIIRYYAENDIDFHKLYHLLSEREGL
ncbi:ATP-binding protein [Vagococcus fessus]|uniref:Helicase HerA central domain-containing protein n=1 Tax=Vagococcus fessus TaxID=120370 RepID=A0A430A8H9_9ENTE|nr:DUF87 domain-containing protein [Vagococcus fessus]RSU03422.1 hypothetical protein CBF31_06840 [Vagococcus fessus]